MFERFYGYAGSSAAKGTPTYSLPVDILETEDAYEIHASVAGASPDNVEVTFEGGLLNIDVTAVPVQVEGKLIRQERPRGNWNRQLELPKKVDSAKIEAEFENGTLKVRIPKLAKEKPLRIAVRGAANAIEA